MARQAVQALPEDRYGPDGVCKRVENDDDPGRRQINAQAGVHFQTCGIVDPRHNMVWVTPEGGGGPDYGGM